MGFRRGYIYTQAGVTRWGICFNERERGHWVDESVMKCEVNFQVLSLKESCVVVQWYSSTVVVVVSIVRSSILDSSKHAVTVLLSSTCTPSTSCYLYHFEVVAGLFLVSFFENISGTLRPSIHSHTTAKISTGNNDVGRILSKWVQTN